MRMVFGLLGLVVVLAVVGMLVRGQMGATRQAVPALVPQNAATPAADATVREQSQNVQQQFKQAVEGAMSAPRPMPDGQ